MTRSVRRWVAGIVVGACVGCATLPLVVSGSWVRARIEGLPAAAREASLPLRLEVLRYEQGLYGARYAMAVWVAGIAHGSPVRVEGQMRHRMLGAGGTATLAGDDWAVGLAGTATPRGPIGPDL